MFNPEGKELVGIICNYLSGALEEAVKEVEMKEDLDEEVDPLDVAQKHITKSLSYMQDEGWLEE
jgi:hypothetical protein